MDEVGDVAVAADRPARSAATTRPTTSTSARAASARAFVRSPSSVRARCSPGVSRSTSWLVGVCRTPRTAVRVVWGREEVIATLVPTRRFTRLDLPDVGPARRGSRTPSGTPRVRRTGRRGDARRARRRPSAGGDRPVMRTDTMRRPWTRSVRNSRSWKRTDLALVGDVAEQVEHEAADGVPLGVGQLDAERLVHVVDGHPAGDAQRPVGEVLDARLLDVVLVGDLADDLLEEVLEGDDARRCRRTRRRRPPCGTACVCISRSSSATCFCSGTNTAGARRVRTGSAPPPPRARWTRSFR